MLNSPQETSALVFIYHKHSTYNLVQSCLDIREPLTTIPVMALSRRRRATHLIIHSTGFTHQCISDVALSSWIQQCHAFNNQLRPTLLVTITLTTQLDTLIRLIRIHTGKQVIFQSPGQVTQRKRNWTLY
ncbi:hypothetical protein AMELA_G00209110 [Ameiurus melas]|uniref:Uncharacterized protein n=1 Tax=Ameiurus melas TaxID=219545 RepID=A0A7J6A5S5_AMEME|nr:hypothetical protein AMELA_G00209110 [Ameiurus melas]